MTLDSNYGVPTMALHTHVFQKVVETVTRIHGMPEARYAFVPQPVMGKTAEQLRAYVDGNDPLSGRPVRTASAWAGVIRLSRETSRSSRSISRTSRFTLSGIWSGSSTA